MALLLFKQRNELEPAYQEAVQLYVASRNLVDILDVYSQRSTKAEIPNDTLGYINDAIDSAREHLQMLHKLIIQVVQVTP